MKKRVYGQWAGNPRGYPENAYNCIEQVYGQREYTGHQCPRKRGQGKDGLYCAQHAKRHPAKAGKEERYKAYLRVREIKTREIIDSVGVSSLDPGYVERVMSGMLRQMNTHDYLIDDSEVDKARKEEEA